MILQVFAILDVKSGAYAHPSFMATKGVAIRSFLDICRDPQMMMAKHPHDYALYHIGSFNDMSGQFVQEGPPVVLLTAVEAIASGE